MVANQENNPKKKIRGKDLQIRDAPLIVRYENNEDIRTIYNLFGIILISLLINTIVYDYTKKGKFHFGLRLIALGFNKFPLVILVWVLLNLVAFLAYCAFNVWALVRNRLQLSAAKFWDKLWLTITIIYYFCWFYGLQKTVAFLGFAPCSSAVLLIDGTRLIMKQHAFIRTNITKVLSYKPHSDKVLKLPSFRNFLYFLFAPIMIYRDEYPRTRIIRWRFVLYNLGEIFGLIWLLSLVVERFLVPPFEDICLRKYTWTEVLIPVMTNSFPGILFMLCGFYSVLHSTQNAFAEMLRFGDRMFYQEWWNSKSLSEYYRTWNVLVHDWLYTYIFKDMYEIITPGKKTASKLAVFLISALVHEWILTNTFKFFLPVQFIEFFISGTIFALLNIVDLPIGNLLIWYLIIFGSGMQVNLYTLEIFARINCPLHDDTPDPTFFKLRCITCKCIQ